MTSPAAAEPTAVLETVLVHPGDPATVAALTALVTEYVHTWYIQTWYEPGEPLRPEDAELLADLPGRHAWPTGAALLALAQDAPVGCVLLGPTDDPTTGEVRKMYVRPGARRRGVAALLLMEAEAVAGALGLRRLMLQVHPERAEALSVYRRAGYRPIGGDLDGVTVLGKTVTDPDADAAAER